MGSGARNKGMALFPRKIHGKYTMVSRLDGENLFLMSQMTFALGGFQTAAGAEILLGAGANRQLWLANGDGGRLVAADARGGSDAAVLHWGHVLDLNDPSKIIGQTQEPLFVPTAEESSGYVPNVVYSCGGMIHNELVVIPYAMSDGATSLPRSSWRHCSRR